MLDIHENAYQQILDALLAIIIPGGLNLLILTLEIEGIFEERRLPVIMPPGIRSDALQGVPRLFRTRIVQVRTPEIGVKRQIALLPPPQIARKMTRLEIVQGRQDLDIPAAYDIQNVLIVLLVLDSGMMGQLGLDFLLAQSSGIHDQKTGIEIGG